MTTAEKFRRRQRIEGALVVLIALAMLVQIWYYHQKQSESDRAMTMQTKCLREKFSELNESLGRRSKVNADEFELNQRDTAESRRLWLIYAEAAQLIKAKGGEKNVTQAEVHRLNQKFIRSLLIYKVHTKQIQEQRRENRLALKKNPLPPYPQGICKQD